MSFVYWFVGCSSTSSLGSVSFFTVNASPINSGTAAVTVVDGLYQEDVAIVPAAEPAVQPDVQKPEEASIQALSIPTLHPRRKIMPLMHVHSSCGSLGQQAVIVRDIGFSRGLIASVCAGTILCCCRPSQHCRDTST